MVRAAATRILATFVTLDLVFTGLLAYSFLIMMGLEGDSVDTTIAVLAALSLVKLVGLVTVIKAAVRPLAPWTGSPEDEIDAATIREVASAAYRVPFTVGVSWATLFAAHVGLSTSILYFGFADTVPLGPRNLEGSVFVVLAIFVGVVPLAFPLVEWLMAPLLESISLTAHERGVAIPGRGMSFRVRLIVYSLAIAVAPSLYLGASNYMNDAQRSQRDLERQADLAVAEAALGHPDAARAMGGWMFTFDAAGANIDGQEAARALADHPALARSFGQAVRAAPAGSVAHPRHGVVAWRTEGDRRLGVVIEKLPSVSLGTILLLAVFLVIIAIWGPLSATFMANATATPVKRVSDALARVREGEVATAPRVPVFHQDEVGVLATSYNSMLDQLRELAQRAGEVSKGDLAVELGVRGDLGEAFRGQLVSLRDMVGHIARSADQLARAASEMYAAAQEQEVTARQQSIGVEEVSRTMASLLAAATHVTESTMGVLDRAERTLETTSRTTERIGEMSGHASRIGEILEIIREIADRSDLLALNASLEGSHAGEAGRGFALVAGEMRKLAERVTESVHDIKRLVADVRASVSATVLATEESSKLAEGTTESARQIKLVTQQQRSGTEQAGQSMRDVAAMITQSLVATQQIRTLAENLKVQAESLTGLVARFRLPKRPRAVA